MVTLLIHGYGLSLHGPSSNDPEDVYNGFDAWSDDINKQLAISFSWRDNRRYTWIQLANPLTYYRHYFIEKRLSSDSTVLENLNNIILQNSPTVIICHSMGCNLLLNYLAKYPLGLHIKIIFIQSDADYNARLDYNITNITQVFDISLVMSSLINIKLRQGLCILPTANKRQLFWHRWYPNNHADCIKDKRLKEYIDKLTNV
jgi:hypothetical protein